MKTQPFLLWLALMVLALPAAAAAKGEPLQSGWAQAPLKIDGDTGDWQTSPFQFEKSAQVEYAFRNDAAFLYLAFVFKDAKYVSSLAQTGFTVWLNDQGKKKKKIGLLFEKKTVSAADLVAMMEKQGGPLPEEQKKKILAKPGYVINQFKAIDDDRKDQTAALFPQPPLPECISASAADRLAFEFRVPVGAGNGLNLAPGKSLTVGFEWGGLTKEMRQALMRRGGYEGGGGGSTVEGVDLDPEGSADPGGSELPSRLHGPKHYLFWCDLVLASETK